MSYDGDDWGEVDDQDQYGTHEPPPPPQPRPTGLRQRGQGLSSDSPPLPGQGQGRSFTNPIHAEPEPLQGRRTFSAGDPVDPRANVAPFNPNAGPPSSSNAPYPPQPQSRIPSSQAHTPIHLQTQGLGPEAQGLAFPNYDDGLAERDPQQGHPSGTRELSGPSMPSSLQSRASPGPPGQGPVAAQTADRFPPRKSSLSQQTPLMQPTPPVQPRRDSQGQSQPEAAMPGRERTSSNPQKALPFIRPSDIYKRMNEERERERQSLDSSRPSMDSINNSRPNPDELSAAGGLGKSPRTDSPGRAVRRTPSMEGMEDADSNRRLKPMLDPVTERKSEYGYDGSALADATRAYGPGGVTDVAQSDSEAFEPQDRSRDHSEAPPRPTLPNVHRVSGFGDDFLSPQISSSETTPQVPRLPPQTMPAASQPALTQREPAAPTDAPLQHQRSIGFRSAVNQAFDPVTPVSTSSGSQRSQQGLAPSRSDSASTAGVSPIMSHVSVQSNDPRVPPGVAEGNRQASDLSRNAQQSAPGQYAAPNATGKAPSAPADASEDARRPFVPGHRRDLSTPSPNNSPRRSPVLEENRQSHTGEEEVEIAQATPIEPSRPPFASQDGAADLGRADPGRVDSGPPVNATGPGSTAGRPLDARAGFVPHHKNMSTASVQSKSDSLRSESSIPAAESPSKGKVKNLAGQFEAARSRSSSAHSSGRAGSASPARRIQEELGAPRPIVARDQSFRPPLPGGWVSYATTAAPSTPGSLSRTLIRRHRRGV